MKIIIGGKVVEVPSGGSSGSGIPSGGIIIWSGAADNIPDGWALCDGENGTPDLRGMFVLGASENHPIGEMGGSEEITLTTEQMPKHRHNLNFGTVTSSSSSTTKGVVPANSSQYGTSIAMVETGFSQPHPNMPPYYTLAYIMKT